MYISGNSYFGETGPDTKQDESRKPNPTGFGPYVTDAAHAVQRRNEKSLDAAIAFPGAVYGDGAWLKQYTLDPLRAGKPVGDEPVIFHQIRKGANANTVARAEESVTPSPNPAGTRATNDAGGGEQPRGHHGPSAPSPQVSHPL
ncbi:chlorophyll a-b binding domain-containing protein [Streptomyces prunicolor]|uniref:Uncharacterized protein n=1 Tax=Streptomyces prunicolor TaxID=67348 RepID=A0ABU4F5Z0_9ACTN|nr:hypothetical protein [Streptomyces prunicolor]MDV7215980.1 hypothetical protein [Streptomyces prunicolor]